MLNAMNGSRTVVNESLSRSRILRSLLSVQGRSLALVRPRPGKGAQDKDPVQKAGVVV